MLLSHQRISWSDPGATQRQFLFIPSQVLQSLGHQPLRFPLAALLSIRTVMIGACTPFRGCQQFLPKCFAAQTPAPSQPLIILRLLLRAPKFHPLRELLVPGLRVAGDPRFPQHPVHPQPRWALLRRLEILTIAAPVEAFQGRSTLDQFRPNRIQMNIVAHHPQIAAAAPLDNQRLVTPGKKMPAFLMPDVEPLGINPQQPLQAGHQILLGRFDYEVKMIAHETPGMHLPARLFASLRQRRQKHLPVMLPTKYLLPPVPAIHHMINRPGILNA